MYKSDQNQSGTKFNRKIKFNVLWVRFSGNMIKYKYLMARKREIKSISNIPVILFPGGVNQINKHFDAVHFVSDLTMLFIHVV